MSLRGRDWCSFSVKVLEHIETYTIPQYGDKGDDQADDFTIDDCMKHITRYARRQGKNSRPNQDMQDLLKIAHYAQLAALKLEEQNERQ